MNYLLIGKPNVGKSSIYNILVGTQSNIIHSKAGTTRDWHKNIIKGTTFNIFDTPGIIINNKIDSNFFLNDFDRAINKFLYVIEYKDFFNSYDNNSINQLRKFNKDIILLINKFDNHKVTPSNEFTKYGLNQFYGWHLDGGGDGIAAYSKDKNRNKKLYNIDKTNLTHDDNWNNKVRKLRKLQPLQ